MAELVSRAINAIEEMDRRTIFVKVERIMRKKDRLEMSVHQSRLYNWIRKQPGGFVKLEITMGMNLMILGLLKAKGWVEDAENDGVKGIRAR